MKNKMRDMGEFDKTLTPEERAAPTFIEWSDSTLARGVRDLAVKLHDDVGFNAVVGMAAAICLEKVVKDSNARCVCKNEGIMI